MKKLFIFFLLILTVSAYSQGPWQGFFKPVKALETKYSIGDRAPDNSKYLFRLSAGIQANQLLYNSETKKLEQKVFNKVGLGLSYAHFITVNGELWNNYSFNFFTFLPTDNGNPALSFAATVSALQYINMGVGYDCGINRPYLLTGISYTF